MMNARIILLALCIALIVVQPSRVQGQQNKLSSKDVKELEKYLASAVSRGIDYFDIGQKFLIELKNLQSFLRRICRCDASFDVYLRDRDPSELPNGMRSGKLSKPEEAELKALSEKANAIEEELKACGEILQKVVFIDSLKLRDSILESHQLEAKGYTINIEEMKIRALSPDEKKGNDKAFIEQIKKYLWEKVKQSGRDIWKLKLN